MWVRIDEIAFAAERADEVIGRVRNTAVSMHDGEGFRGFRLQVDKTGGREYGTPRASGGTGRVHWTCPTGTPEAVPPPAMACRPPT